MLKSPSFSNPGPPAKVARAAAWLRQANRGQTGYLRGAAGTSAVGGRPVGRGGGRPAGRSAGGGHETRSVGRVAVSVSVDFQFKAKGTLPNLTLPENKRGEAESYTKVHFSE